MAMRAGWGGSLNVPLIVLLAVLLVNLKGMIMSTSINAIVFAGFSIIAGCALALEPVMEAQNVVTVTSPRYQLGADEFMYLGGSYGLDNGTTLNFVKSGINHFFVTVGDLPRTEVFAVSGNRFVARDRSIQMVFEPHESGMATNITVQYAINRVGLSGAVSTEFMVAKN
jgi:hypothetical protein